MSAGDQSAAGARNVFRSLTSRLRFDKGSQTRTLASAAEGWDESMGDAGKDGGRVRMTRKNSIFYIRMTVAIIMAYMTLFEPHSIHLKYWAYFYVALYMGTNLVLSYVPESYFYNKNFYYLLVGFDTVMIAAGIFLTGQADSYFFLLYFLIIGIASMSMNIKYLMMNTIMFIIIYGWLLYVTGHFQGEMTTVYALRLPFVLITSLLFGYVIECMVDDVNRNIKESEEKFRSLVQSIDSPVFMLDARGRFLSVNEKLVSELGLPKERILNRRFGELHSREETELFRSNAAKVFEQGTPTQFVSYNPERDKWSLNVLSPVKEFKTDRIQALSAVSKDITENVKSERALRKAYDELKKTQEQLIQKNKLEAIGRLASGVAHQIRNPLEIILMGVEFLEDSIDQGDDMARQSMDKVKSAVHRANRTIEDVLRFSRNTEFSFDSVNICGLLDETIGFVQHKLNQSNVRAETSYADRDLCVKADKNTLQQVFLNIMSNAVEAIGENGRIDVRVYTASGSTSGQHLNGEDLNKPVYSDTSSGLSNRRLFLYRLKQAIARARRFERRLVVMFVGLERLRTPGKQKVQSADELSVHVIGRRLNEAVRESDTVVRIGRNLFMCLLEDLPDEETASRIGSRIHRSTNRPFLTGQTEIWPDTRVGYSVYPDQGTHMKSLLEQAKAALIKVRNSRELRVLGYQEMHNEGPDAAPVRDGLQTATSGGKKGEDNGNSWVVVEIEDDGPGMPESVASKIFEPFFTTKQASKGTGLGLSMANLIIERHQGVIELDSKEGRGSKFTIKLLPG
jgi:diguanylate cyclase (GGDEF)-like protein/PAS domain S-box-containing protein